MLCQTGAARGPPCRACLTSVASPPKEPFPLTSKGKPRLREACQALERTLNI